MSQLSIRPNTTRLSILIVTMVASLTLVLTGCVQQTSGPLSEPSTGPSPTSACPYVEGMPTDPGCAYYDPDAAMAQNERYRERRKITAETEELGKAMIPKITAALQPLSEAGAILTQDAVTKALLSIGIDERSLRLDGEPPETSGVAFGISIKGGCVFGGVAEGQVQVEVGGGIMDGGCLEMRTH